MNIFDLKPKGDMDYFQLGEFVSIKNKGKNKYRVIEKLLEEKKFRLEPWSNSRPINRPTILESVENLKSLKITKYRTWTNLEQ